jgi:hypothetical protein
MGSEKKSDIKTFFDHLYFSVCCILVGFLLVYCVAGWMGYGFSVDANMTLCVVIGTALSLILAAYFTYVSIARRPSDFIVQTRRQR